MPRILLPLEFWWGTCHHWWVTLY